MTSYSPHYTDFERYFSSVFLPAQEFPMVYFKKNFVSQNNVVYEDALIDAAYACWVMGFDCGYGNGISDMAAGI